MGLPLAQAIGMLVSNDNAPINDMVEAYSRSWQQLRALGNLDEPLFEGTHALLSSLKAANWTLGVATGKSMRGLKHTLELHGLDAVFETLQTADIARGKPHPEMLHLAMAETNAVPNDTVMIGDTTYDIEMAVAAGVRALGVAWGYHSREDLEKAGAAEVFETVGELELYFMNLEDGTT